ncbi:MAG: hypothetical protein FWD19_00870 [Defluviitaleaceae bacterium]|nr:hypothetical protein [Defluviitaleaceae bacterium]
MKITILSRVLIVALFVVLIFFAISNPERSLPADLELIELLEQKNAELLYDNSYFKTEMRAQAVSISQLEADLEKATADPDELPDEDEKITLRVFYNGNSDVWLYPDGRFIFNYFHNIKKSGTYTEIFEEEKTIVHFTHNGALHIGSRAPFFEPSGFLPVTVTGVIEENFLTIPEEWDDDCEHGVEFRLRQPLVFIAEDNDNKITLNVDRTFIAEFYDEILVLGYFAARSRALDHDPTDGDPMPYMYNSVTFIPGMPTFNTSGVLQGAIFAVPIREGKILTIPDPWISIAGAETFILLE